MIGSIPRVDREHTIHDYIPGQPIPAIIRDSETGKLFTNPLKKYVEPFTLTTDPVEIVLSGNQLSEPIPMVIDSKGHFEIMRAFFKSSQDEGFTVQILDTDQRPILMNREVHVATIASGSGVVLNSGVLTAASSGGRPFIWPETFWMDTDSRRAIICVFRNLSSSANTIRFHLDGLRWYHSQAPSKVADRMQQIYRGRLRSFPFFYTTDRQASLLMAGGPFGGERDSFDVRFGDDSWTEWSKGMSITSPGSARYNVRIVETMTNKRFMDAGIRDDLVFGNGELPFLLWESALFEPNYKLTFELENLSLVSNSTIYITLGCRKILPDPKDDRLLRPGQAAGESSND